VTFPVTKAGYTNSSEDICSAETSGGEEGLYFHITFEIYVCDTIQRTLLFEHVTDLKNVTTKRTAE